MTISRHDLRFWSVWCLTWGAALQVHDYGDLFLTWKRVGGIVASVIALQLGAWLWNKADKS